MISIESFFKLINKQPLKKEEIKLLEENFGKASIKELQDFFVQDFSNFKLSAECKELIEKTAQENHLSLQGFNFITHAKLFPLIQLLCKFEHCEEEAYRYTIKLTILFNSTVNVLTYLKRFLSKNLKKNHKIQIACNFHFPLEGSFDIKLWQELATLHMPSNHFLRLLPLAGKIEKFVKENRGKLEYQCREETVLRYKLIFLKKYNGLSIKFKSIETEEESIRKILKKESQKQFGDWMNQKLDISPRISPTSEQREQLKALRTSPEAKIKIEELKVKMESQVKVETMESSSPKRMPKLDKDKYVIASIKNEQATIEADCQTAIDQILSNHTPLLTLFNYGKQVCYSRLKENPIAAYHFFDVGMPAPVFDFYLSLRPIDNPKIIPDIFIDGDAIGYPGYYFKKISPFNPKAATVGKQTSCCQYLWHPQGRFPTIHAITSENGGYYALYQKRGLSPSEDDRIISQSWIWKSIKGNMVFDSIETHIDFRENHSQMISDFFMFSAHLLVTHHNIPRVVVGRNKITPKELCLLKSTSSELSIENLNHPDSRIQHIIADKKLPCVESYLFTRKDKIPALLKLKVTKDIIAFEDKEEKLKQECLKLSDIYEWATLCLINRQKSIVFLPSVQEGMHALSLKSDIIEEYVTNTEKLHGALDKEKIDWKTVIDLISSNADIDIPRRSDDCTPLHMAVSNGNLQMVEWLMSASANVNCDSPGKTPLILAASAGNLAIAKRLLEAGAIINISQKIQKWTALHEAAMQGHIEMCKLLLLNAAYINANCQLGRTPLHIAAASDHADLFMFLIHQHADVNLSDKNGNTALHFAVSNDKLPIVKILAENGADLLCRNDKNQTSLDIAIGKSRSEIITYLSEKMKLRSETNNLDSLIPSNNFKRTVM